jgi:hypothetical protein
MDIAAVNLVTLRTGTTEAWNRGLTVGQCLDRCRWLVVAAVAGVWGGGDTSELTVESAGGWYIILGGRSNPDTRGQIISIAANTVAIIFDNLPAGLVKPGEHSLPLCVCESTGIVAVSVVFGETGRPRLCPHIVFRVGAGAGGGGGGRWCDSNGGGTLKENVTPGAVASVKSRQKRIIIKQTGDFCLCEYNLTGHNR